MPLLSVYYPYREAVESRKMSADQNGAYEERVYYVQQIDPNKIWASGMLPRWMAPHPDWAVLPNFYAESIAVYPPTRDLHDECKVVIKYREYLYDVTPAGETWRWDFTEQQTHISSVPNESYVIHYPSDADVGLAIGTDGERTEGVDVARTGESIVVTKLWTNVDWVGRAIIAALANTINATYWMDYNIGEVKFDGAQIRKLSNGLDQVQYNFTARRTLAPFNVTLYDSTVIPVAPRPWDYVWYRYIDSSSTDGEGNEHLNRGIRSIHISQVYDYANFHVLGLAGPIA